VSADERRRSVDAGRVLPIRAGLNFDGRGPVDAHGHVSMTSDRELWVCAVRVLQQHGEAAVAFVSDRVATLARAGDEAGVRTWLVIASRIDALTDRPEQAAH
jgi:hypothetical protein